jgi:hypothetical protein
MNQILRQRVDATHHKGNFVVVWRTESRLKREEHVYVARGGGLEPLQSWIDREVGKQTDGAGNGNSIKVSTATAQAQGGQQSSWFRAKSSMPCWKDSA